jgi:hypothetical protein
MAKSPDALPLVFQPLDNTIELKRKGRILPIRPSDQIIASEFTHEFHPKLRMGYVQEKIIFRRRGVLYSVNRYNL